jgi:hypothetical protein
VKIWVTNFLSNAVNKLRAVAAITADRNRTAVDLGHGSHGTDESQRQVYGLKVGSFD